MTTQPLSFPQAIAQTQSLMDKIQANKLNETEIKQAISSVIDTKNGGRGFFVAYLTSNSPLADNPSTGVIEALKSSIEVVSELLVKNVAMSSAMIIAHSRNNDRDNIEGSQRVCQRTINLIQQLKSELVSKKLQRLEETITNKQGDYQDFLERWNYDTEQKQAIEKTIMSIL